MNNISQAEWPTKTLGQVATVVNGGTPKSKVVEYWGGSVQWLTPKDMGRMDGREIEKTPRTITESGLGNSSARLIPENSVILSTRAPIGHLAINTIPMAFNQGCRGLVPKEGLDHVFLYYFLYANREFLQELGTGATFKELSSSNLKSVSIMLPPLGEQRRIVAVLDEAFEGLKRVRAHAEANLENARGFFLSMLREVFRNDSRKWETNLPPDPIRFVIHRSRQKTYKKGTQTGGRTATLRPITGPYSLSVLDMSVQPRPGWKWARLADLARLESGHTPSRKHPEYWGGNVSWMGIKDARGHHGKLIESTLENTNDLGISNSSARILPPDTVCLSRTASVGYVTMMGRAMATSQDFVNWVCGDALLPEFLMFLLLAQGEEFRRFSSGSVHQTIYYPEVKAFNICHPPVSVQQEICISLKCIAQESTKLVNSFDAKLQDLDTLRQSLLQSAFAGELT